MVEGFLGEWPAHKDRVGVSALLLAAVELRLVGGALLGDGGLGDGGRRPALGRNQRLLYLTVGIVRVKPPRSVSADFRKIVISREEEMIMRVRVRVDKVLRRISWRRTEGTLDMDLVLALTREGRKGVAERADVVLNIVYVAKVKLGNPLPQHGIGPDGPGGTGGEVTSSRLWIIGPKG